MNQEFVRQNARRITRRVLRWGRTHFQSYPWREQTDYWLTLVAEIMLSRTRASAVSQVYPKFASRFPTPSSLNRDLEPELAQIMAPLGLSWRVPLVVELACALGSETPPANPGELQKLPAIGPYVAAAHASLHRNRRATIVDANVVRWICRMVGEEAGPETRRQRWLTQLADLLTPVRSFRDYNYGVLDLSMTVCTPAPRCDVCPVVQFCAFSVSGSKVSDENVNR